MRYLIKKNVKINYYNSLYIPRAKHHDRIYYSQEKAYDVWRQRVRCFLTTRLVVIHMSQYVISTSIIGVIN